MSTNYPVSLDSFTNPTGISLLSDTLVTHHLQHANLNDAVAALQTKVGANASAVAGTLDKRIATIEAIPPGPTTYAALTDAVTAALPTTNNALITALAAKADTSALAGKADATATSTALAAKQPTLVSGTNIKTLNGATVLGSGDIVVPTTYAALTDAATASIPTTNTALAAALTAKADGTATTNALATKQPNLVSGTSIKTINGATVLGAGDIVVSGIVAPTAVPYATALKLDSLVGYKAAAKVLTANDAYTVLATPAPIDGGEWDFSLYGSGKGFAPVWSATVFNVGGAAYSDVAGIPNQYAVKWLDGQPYASNITGRAIGIISDSNVTNANTSQVTLTLSRAYSGSLPAASAFSGTSSTGGAFTCTAVVAIDTTHFGLTVNRPFVISETISLTVSSMVLLDASSNAFLANMTAVPVTNGIVAAVGSLSGTVATPITSTVNITAQANADYFLFGSLATGGQDNRKAGATAPMTINSTGTNLTRGAGSINNAVLYTYTDGTPTTSGGTGNAYGVWAPTATASVATLPIATIPIGTASTTITIDLGTYYNAVSGTSPVTLRAHLSDSSAADYTFVMPAVASTYSERVVTITGYAAAAGQTLALTLSTPAGATDSFNFGVAMVSYK